MAQYVFTMNRVGKIVPPKRQILKDISLSFFPGAKIGLLGLNGSGKSTVLKIMAGIDKDIIGEATPMPNLSIGYLPQEPQLDPQKVRQEVESGMGEVMQAQEKLEAVYAAYAEEDADFDKLAEEQARLEAIIAASGADTEHQLRSAADALRLPPWDAGSESLWRREAPCCLVQTAALAPDMLLLDEPTNHLDAESVEWLEQFLVRFPGTVVAVTHDRYFLDNAAEWILELDRGHGIPGRATTLPIGWNRRKRAWSRSQAGRRAHEGDEARTGMGAQNPKARQAKSKARLARLRRNVQKSNTKSATRRRKSSSRPENVSGDKVIEFADVSPRLLATGY
jgi:sulfate-transporting ATPase